MTNNENNDLLKMRQRVADIALAKDTAAFIFIAQHRNGAMLSTPMVSDESGEQEMKLVADYLTAVEDRTGKDRETLCRMIVEKLNEIERIEKPQSGETND